MAALVFDFYQDLLSTEHAAYEEQGQEMGLRIKNFLRDRLAKVQRKNFDLKAMGIATPRSAQKLRHFMSGEEEEELDRDLKLIESLSVVRSLPLRREDRAYDLKQITHEDLKGCSKFSPDVDLLDLCKASASCRDRSDSSDM